MNIHEKYSSLIAFGFIGLTFSGAFPILLPILMAYFFLTYWIEKYRSNNSYNNVFIVIHTYRKPLIKFGP